MRHLYGTGIAGHELLGYYDSQDVLGTGLVRLLRRGILGGWSLADIFLDHNLHWLLIGA